MENIYDEMDTEDLVDQMAEAGLDLDFKLVNEIVKRPDAVEPLMRVIQFRPGSGNGWAGVHTIHLLGQIKTEESLDALIYAMVNRQDYLDEWVSEDLPGLLARFGPAAVQRLKPIIEANFVDEYVRGSSIGAISAAAWLYPEKLKAEVMDYLKHIVATVSHPLVVADAVCELAEWHERSAVEVITKAFDENRVDIIMIKKTEALDVLNGKEEGISPEDTLKRSDGYFTEKNFEQLRESQEDADETEENDDAEFSFQPKKGQKSGRNDPCPCGSGKKYKKCCLKI